MSLHFLVVCGMSHNSSQFESYDLMKLEDLICHLEAPKGQSSQSGLRDFKR
jgi:hypothetical protein